MSGYFSGDDASPSSGGSTPAVGTASYDTGLPSEAGGGSAAAAGAASSPPTAGQFSMDLLDVPGSIGNLAESGLGLGSGLLGGVAGAVGSIGIPGGPHLSDIPGAAGKILGVGDSQPNQGLLGAVGQVGVPGGPNLGGAAQVGLGALNLPSQAVQRTVAGARVENALGNKFAAGPLGLLTSGTKPSDLPADVYQKLMSGQMTIAQAADELVKRGTAFTNAPTTNMALSMLLDPMNLMPGVGKLAEIGGKAGLAVRAADAAEAAGQTVGDIGMATRMAGTAYNAATTGLNKAGSVMMDSALGHSTSGLIHAFGVGPYKSLVGAVGDIAEPYANALQDALGVANANFTHTLLGKELADRVNMALKSGNADLAKSLVDATSTPANLRSYLTSRALDPANMRGSTIQRGVQNMLERLKSDWGNLSPDELRAQGAKSLAQAVPGMSAEDAAKVFANMQGRTLLQGARMAHAAAYGQAITHLDVVKDAVHGLTDFGQGRTAENLTLIAHDTLTGPDQRALLAQLAKGGKGTARAIDDAINRFSVLKDHYGNLPRPTVEELTKYLKGVESTLPERLETAKTGAHALPGPLGDFRQKWGESYDLGFAPQDAWKTFEDPATGEQMASRPFVQAVSDKAPVTMRNPLGRVADAMFRGINQSTIKSEARFRFIKDATQQAVPEAGMTTEEARGVFRSILNAAIDRNTTPRGLALHEGDIASIFRSSLGETRYAQYIEHGGNPVWAVMHAFENDWHVVGATQALTGRLKTSSHGLVAAVAEGVYPLVKFRLSPLFLAQEAFETPFWKTLRGILPRVAGHGGIDPAVASLYKDLIDLKPVRQTFEAGYTTQLAGAHIAATLTRGSNPLAAAFARFIDVDAAKARGVVEQVAFEHGPLFRDALNSINPRLAAIFEEAYKTSDWRQIASKFMAERNVLATDPAGAMALVRQALPVSHDAAVLTVFNGFMDSLETAERQAFRTMYFNPERGWLERTLNHPYLGLYPLSYMYGKVLPEFARFLLVRPFGLNAPLVGYSAALNLQRGFQAWMASDPNGAFQQAIADSPESIYLAQLLMPGSPWDIPTNAPAWLRHTATGTFNPGTLPTDTINALGPFRDFTLAGRVGKELGVGQSLQDQLTSAGQLLDQMLGRR